jgi:leucine dehydrogenase
MQQFEVFKYMEKYGYENVCLCQDEAVDFKAVIAIHSTALGPAAGGTRMWKYDSEMDAVFDAMRLARGMTYKYAAAGVNLGGGKAVIIGDPKRRDREVTFRTLGKFINRLGGKYYTGEDVGTTLDDMEYMYMETPYMITLPEYLGGIGPISPMTAFGVIQAMRASAKEVFGSDDLKGKRVAVQGVGSVGSSVVAQLLELGAGVLVSDIEESRVNDIAQRFEIREIIPPDAIYDVDCDVFCPCALGAIINDDTIPRLRCKIVCGSANNQLKEERHGDMLQQRGIFYAPDYVANGGGAIYDSDRLFAGGLVNKERARAKVARIYERMEELIKIAKRDKVPSYRAADIMAEERIASVGKVKRHWETMRPFDN